MRLGLQNEREWKVFCDGVLHKPELAADPLYDSNARRNDNRAGLKAIILDVFSGMTAQQVVDRLDAAGIANARVNTMDDVWGHPQLAARNRIERVDTPAGEVKAFLPPGVNNRFDHRMDPIPSVGQHTASILREIGYDEAQVDAMRQQGAVG